MTMQRQYIVLLTLAVLSAVGSLYASNTSHLWLESIGSTLAAGFFGSFVTVLLIDRALGMQRQAETDRLRLVALRQLRPALI